LQKEKLKIWKLLIERGFARDKSHAESLLLSGSVLIQDKVINKLGLLVEKNVNIRIRQKIPDYVSRGALKIKPILEKWNISIKGKVCIDLGASTGGFTQVLLEKGASLVYAVDVGYGQLAGKLQNHPKVKVLDRTHYKNLNLDLIKILGEEIFVTMDLSFTSVIPALKKIQELFYKTNKRVEGLSLIKPQFEAKTEELEKGIVKNSSTRFKILKRTLGESKKIHTLNLLKLTQSPLEGTKGNIEYFLYWKLF
jgi:23S rRNA (cytidine1920-2'-O)/16S rRNA (cytidine1409-2'-O)-methyltransferase